MSLDLAELFSQNGYLKIENFLSSELVNIFNLYTSMQRKYDFTPETGEEAQVLGAHGRYSDFLAETYLQMLLPAVSNAIQDELYPTYSYYRLYNPGNKLIPHVDREACEVSVTICLSNNYWPFKIAIDRPYDNDFIYYNGVNVEKAISIDLKPGDALVYAGKTVAHWREPLEAKQQHLQLFLHYVRAKGQYADHKYDKRDSLGMPRISPCTEYVKESYLMQNIINYLREKREI